MMTLCILMTLALAQNSPDSSAANQRALPGYIQGLEFLPKGTDRPIASVDHPLFNYTDSARIIAEGAIWAWGGEGRPLAMAKCWKNRNGSQTCAFSLTSDELVVVRGPQAKIWTPQEVQIEPAKLPGAPAPDAKETVRLRQLKEQARRFTAHEFWNPDNSRFELRLLIQPVHRYQDEKRGILDGAVFLLAYDNNPQVLLLLEILKDSKGDSHWQYLIGRVSSADLHVALDGKEVWKRSRTPGIIGQSTDYYWHMVTF